MSEPESSSPPPKTPKPHSASLPLWVVAVVAVVVMTAGVALAWLLSGGIDSLAKNTASSRTEPATPTPEATPSAPTPTEVPVAKATPVDPTPEVPKAIAVSPPTTLGPPTAPAVPVDSPILSETVTAVDFNPEASGNTDVRSEVLKRIDLMPTIKPEVKDKLYAQVDRSRAMGMLIRIPFAPGKTTISAKDLENLKAATQSPSVQKLVLDPTAVFVILGYADTKGSASGNYTVSLARADNVLENLRDKCGLQNVMHSVAMGGSDFFDAKQADKNRLAEVWAVLP